MEILQKSYSVKHAFSFVICCNVSGILTFLGFSGSFKNNNNIPL